MDVHLGFTIRYEYALRDALSLSLCVVDARRRPRPRPHAQYGTIAHLLRTSV